MKASGLARQVWHWVRWPVYVLVVGAILFFAWGVYLNIEKDKTQSVEVSDFVPPKNMVEITEYSGGEQISYYMPATSTKVK